MTGLLVCSNTLGGRWAIRYSRRAPCVAGPVLALYGTHMWHGLPYPTEPLNISCFIGNPWPPSWATTYDVPVTARTTSSEPKLSIVQL